MLVSLRPPSLLFLEPIEPDPTKKLPVIVPVDPVPTFVPASSSTCRACIGAGLTWIPTGSPDNLFLGECQSAAEAKATCDRVPAALRHTYCVTAASDCCGACTNSRGAWFAPGTLGGEGVCAFDSARCTPEMAATEVCATRQSRNCAAVDALAK